ncbi:MAG: hypothetical protein ABJA20_08115 [Novosphingobium sp.]
MPIRRWPSGMAALDTILGGGFAYGRMHEIYAAEENDAGAARGFAVALAAGMSGNGVNVGAPILWVRSCPPPARSGVLQASGWAALGGAPDHLLVSTALDAMALLRTAADALRCRALDMVIVESWGRMRELDLTASRRLALAAEKSGVPLLLLRIAAEPVPSAAQTRWQVAAAPSRALPGRAPGAPTFDITLLRQKSGPSGLDWRLEWDRDHCKFRDSKFRDPALSGAVVPLPVSRPAADTGGLDERHAA